MFRLRDKRSHFVKHFWFWEFSWGTYGVDFVAQFWCTQSFQESHLSTGSMDLGLGFHEIRVQFQEWGFRFQKNRVIAQAQSRPKTKTLGVLHNIFLFCVLILCPLPLWSRKPPAFSQKLCGDCTTDCTTFWKTFPEITLGSQNRWCAAANLEFYEVSQLQFKR